MAISTLLKKLSVATTGVALSLTAIDAKPAQAASLDLDAALTATRVNAAQDLFGVDGTGIKIGVISDSFNTATTFDRFGNQSTYATDIANGYLPQGVQVLQDVYSYNGKPSTDEGRAMLQLVHAVAPGASLVFSSVAASADVSTPDSFANSILALKASGADIIVDDIEGTDVGLVNEPNPPDGAINQAIDSVFNQGVSYFSAAGNDAPNDTIYGHNNSPGAVAVGAVYYGNAQISPDGVTQQGQLESYSSPGDPALPFMKPDVVAPDGLDVSFNLGNQNLEDPTNEDFFDFFGTSASAPFAAASAALLLQAVPNATPSQIYQALRDTAQPLDPNQPGFNLDSGYGLIQVDKAIVELKAEAVPEPSSSWGILAFGVMGTGGLLLKRKQQQKREQSKKEVMCIK